jgi:ABC-type sugar transport system ATPase subunit
VQQVATPRELYERPANAFVAGFIGTPPMNLLPASATSDGDAVLLRIAGQTLRVDGAALARAVAAHPGQVHTAGIRPEEWQLARDGLAARVEHVEFLGHETLVHAAAGDQRLVVRLPGTFTTDAGDELRLGAGSVHLFDAHGQRVG